MILGVPLALGSWWGLPTIIPMMAAIVLRLLDEERFLTDNLPGNREYQQKVRYRLAPSVW
jgi:protein-S-isoprenylcysteine O-methyltransferase Ste14